MASTIDLLLSHRVSAIIRTQDEALADHAIQAAVDGGFRVVEFTLTTPGALSLIEKYSANADLLVGAGTVMSPHLVDEATKAGAKFVVSPVLDLAVINKARDLGVATIPGAFTPLEMQRAHDAGADLVKIFPAPHDLPLWIKQILGPQPYLRLFPTAGITLDTLLPSLQAGAVGAGFVASLFPPQELAEGKFSAIRERAQQIQKLLGALPA